jgi:uncharacterized repeat protein (TIGR03837 family)
MRIPAPRWDIFCRVIDNHGDLGVCWRLARLLAQRGQPVRLWVDDPGALAWMAPIGATGVTVQPWPATPAAATDAVAPGAVVVEAFGCDPPADFVARMAAATPPPVWLNLEYLSAEPFAERSHGLPSPQAAGPGRGLVKWFYYPGFSAASGGLMHGDRADLAAPPLPGRAAWAQGLGLALPSAAPGLAAERLVLVFGYAGLPWPTLLPWLAHGGPARLLMPPGAAQRELADHAARHPLPAGLQWQALPWLPQPAFDTLLAGCDLAIVRGEDSFVRAQLAGDTPFLWQIYPQADGAHRPKLEAFLDRYLHQAPAALAQPLAQAWRALNGLSPMPATTPDHAAWQAHQQAWRQQLLRQSDLVSRLLAFVQAKAAAPAG